MTDGSVTETDGKTQRVTVTDGSLTETDGSLMDMHGSGGQWTRGGGPRSGGSWACAGAGVLVCRCAGVLVCKCAGDRGDVPIYWCGNASADFAMISLQLSYVFARIIL